MLNIPQLSLIRNNDLEVNQRLNPEQLRRRMLDQAQQLADYALDPRGTDDTGEMTLKNFEQAIIYMVFSIARTAVMLFLETCDQRMQARTPTRIERKGKVYRSDRAKARNFETWFGVIRYWRTYYVPNKGTGKGVFPLDAMLGLMSDRISFNLLTTAVRLATKVSFAEARSIMCWFLPTVPSTEVIEHATLGLGGYTAQWFEDATPPEGDGDVLIILVDSKGTPQVTEQALKRRRGKRKGRPKALSPRHRGRSNRGRHESKKRRKKGDKSKNARMATMVVMYTLKSDGTLLLGPINKWVYASFAPKKHAFAIAWREAKKRGFDPKGDDIIQIVTDGDPDLAVYAKYFFPNAIHTLDIFHALERLWDAGQCFYKEGSKELEAWMEEQKELLYGGYIKEVLSELRKRRRAIYDSQKNKSRRERLRVIINYLSERVGMMNYGELADEDLELASGAVEGAVKYIIGKRCDQGGMGWVVERNEAVVQLRCIDANGDWDRFVEHVHEKIRNKELKEGHLIRLQTKTAAPLPDLLEAA